MIEVQSTYQRAQRGTKAWVRWCSGVSGVAVGEQQDTWFFEDSWPPCTVLVVVPSIGWGPHNRDPEVLYLRRAQILATVEPGAHAAAIDLEKRQRNSDAAG